MPMPVVEVVIEVGYAHELPYLVIFKGDVVTVLILGRDSIKRSTLSIRIPRFFDVLQ